MRTGDDRVCQFKLTLKRIKPPIWRRIQVPETYTFWDLHVAIQDAMGWWDYHLHEFEIPDPSDGSETRIGIPDPEGDILGGSAILAGWDQMISDYFSESNQKATYTYDFGDDWKHAVVFEKSLPKVHQQYPVCVAGERACPPEDCGGPWGYQEMLEIIADPSHEEHQPILEWLGGEFDSEHFEIEEIEFDDPEERKKLLFSDGEPADSG